MCAPISRREVLLAGVRLGLGALILPTFTDSLLTPTAAAAAPSAAAAFTPITPARLADTRQAPAAGFYTRTAGNQISVPVRGRAGVPATAVAAALIVTAVGGSATGYLTIWPSTPGEPAPVASLVNHGAGETRCNMAFIKIGDNGSVEVLHSVTDTAVTVDVVGYFTAASDATAGRFAPVSPYRPYDSRQAGGPFAAGEARVIALGTAVPSDAVAVAVNITGVNAPGSGAWTCWAGGTQPSVPNLHLSGSGQTRACSAVVALAGNSVSLHSTAGGHGLIDVVGYFTGPTTPSGSDGLFVAQTPTRVLDTRSIAQPIPAGSSREAVAGPAQCSMLVANITTVAASAAGFGTTWAAGEPRPGTSTINFAGGPPVANLAIVRAGSRGIAVSPSAAVHMIIDIYGHFTGQRSTLTEPPIGFQPYGIAGVDMESYAPNWFDWGTSAQGRPLRGFTYGDGPRRALIVTGLHGNEHSGTSILADLVTRGPIPGWTLHLVPIANPDARAANQRYVGVDMNRDFESDWARVASPQPSGCIRTQTGPAPLTLTESRQLKTAVTTGPFAGVELCVSHHDNYNWVAPQMGSPAVMRTLASEYATRAGIRTPGQGGATVPTSIHYTDVHGGFERFMYTLGAQSILVENKAGYSAAGNCAGGFGQQPVAANVAPHYQALRSLLLDSRLPA